MNDAQGSLFGSSDPCPGRSITACQDRPGETCRCRWALSHIGPHICVNCNQVIRGATLTKTAAVLFAPPTPSGPAAAPYSKIEAEAYGVFRRSDLGVKFWVALVRTALETLEIRERRFSVRGFLYRHRELEKVRINNDFTPWLATELIVAYPQLDAIIERRSRTASV